MNLAYGIFFSLCGYITHFSAAIVHVPFYYIIIKFINPHQMSEMCQHLWLVLSNRRPLRYHKMAEVLQVRIFKAKEVGLTPLLRFSSGFGVGEEQIS